MVSSNQPPERPSRPEHPGSRPSWRIYPQPGDIVMYKERPAIVTEADEEIVSLVPVGTTEEHEDVSLGLGEDDWLPRNQDLIDRRLNPTNVPREVIDRMRGVGPHAVD